MFMEFGQNLQNCTGNKSDVEDARFLINTLHYIFTGRVPDLFSYIPHFNRWQATICLISSAGGRPMEALQALNPDDATDKFMEQIAWVSQLISHEKTQVKSA